MSLAANDTKADEPVDRLLVGAPAIAAYLGLTERQVRAMRESGQSPIGKLPGLGLAVRISKLTAFLEEHGA